MVNKFTQKAADALSYAAKVAEELGHSYIGTEHLLLGLIVQKECIASRILTLRGATESGLRQTIKDYMGIGRKSDLCKEDMTPRLVQIIESASVESEHSGTRFVGTEHLLVALINRKDCVAVKLLEASGVCISQIKSDIASYIGSSAVRAREVASRVDDEAKKPKKSSLLLYGKDLTAEAANGSTDPVFCREEELARITRILCRRSKNNPCLIGEPGVGKTAVVEGLAQRISSGLVPDELKTKRIITLDISSMLAGAKYRGEFEDRIKNVIDEAKRDTDIILFVDEMHIMMGAGGAEGAIDASNILKPALARGEIRMIGATTPTEYRTHVEKDSAFERRFAPVFLAEPNEEECRQILFGLRQKYEEHHNVIISDEAIESAVDLSVRFIHGRFLPDKAIDLIDEASSKLKLTHATNKKCSYDNKMLIEKQKEELIKQGEFEEAHAITLSELQAPTSVLLDVSKSPLVLNPADVASVVSEQTGIPCQNLLLEENQKLLELEESLSSQIIGQPDAISAVADTVRRGRIGLCRNTGPVGSFLFLGSSGVGKTELCRALSKSVFANEKSLIRFDMSEYTEKHSISKLIGAPPGYVGYGEGGILTQKVRSTPYSLVLFDEIEKAHPDFFNLLLQILEDGKLTDSSGRTTDFSSTIIVMTSNIISSDACNARTLGFSESSDNKTSDIRKHPKLGEFFRPEFLSRIDNVILFSALTEENLQKIASIMLDDFKKRAKKIEIDVLTDDSVINSLAKKCMLDNKSSGARPLRREISERIEAPLSRYILEGKAKRGDNVRIYLNFDTDEFDFEILHR